MVGLWFALILILQSQIPVQSDPGTITGRLLKSSGEPEAGIRIAAVPIGAENQTNAPALFGISQTDGDGRYRLENLPPGRYYIFAGLIDLPSYYPNAKSLDRATPIDVQSGATVDGIDFSMAQPTALKISGRLGLPSTMPPGDSWTVTLTSLSRNVVPASIQLKKVERDGSFEFPRIPPGEYRVSSNVTGSTSLTLRVVDADLLDVVLPVIDCNAGAQVSGRVVGPSQTSIRSISLTGSPAGCRPASSVEADGSFLFRNVPVGVYQIQLAPAPLGWNGSALTVDKDTLAEVAVPLPNLTPIKGRAVVEDGSAIPRTVRGTPLPIQAARSPSGEASAAIEDDGAFELLLPKGRYRLSTPGVPPGYYVKSFTAGLQDLSNSIYVVDEKPPEEISITLGFLRKPQAPGVRLTGHLTLPTSGDLFETKSVLLIPSGNRNPVVHESAVGTDRSFEFKGVPPGVYNLETYPDSPAVLYGIVVENTDVTGIEFALPVLVKVRGGIEWADSAGAAIMPARENVSVQFTTREDGNRLRAWGALVQSGSFHFYLPEGDYRFSVTDLPPNFNVGSVTSGDANILETGLRIRSDSTPADLHVRLRAK